MLPDAAVFISYKWVVDLSVHMGNNAFIPVCGQGTAVFALNSRRVLIRIALHVPGLAVLLYSFCAHLHQRGCSFIGTVKDSFHIYFLSFVLSANVSADCHLAHKSLGKAATLGTLHYVQLRCPPKLYPLETLASSSASTLQDSHPVHEDDAFVSEPPASPSTVQTINLHGILGRLDSLTWLVEHLLPSNADAPCFQNVGQLIWECVDRKNKDTFFTTNLLKSPKLNPLF